LFSIVHFSLMTMITFTLLFSNNLYVLIITNTILFCILMLNYRFEDCPISLIEDKYLEESSIDKLTKVTINIFGIKYHKDSRSLITLEMIWIALMLGVQKVLFLLVFKKVILKNIQ
jgi:hypothetical protein